MNEITLIILASLCAILGSISVTFDSFQHRVLAIIALTGGFGPWITMILFFRIGSSESLAWVLISFGPALSFLAAIGYLAVARREKTGFPALLMFIGFVVSVAWLTSYISAIGSATAQANPGHNKTAMATRYPH